MLRQRQDRTRPLNICKQGYIYTYVQHLMGLIMSIIQNLVISIDGIMGQKSEFLFQ